MYVPFVAFAIIQNFFINIIVNVHVIKSSLFALPKIFIELWSGSTAHTWLVLPNKEGFIVRTVPCQSIGPLRILNIA